jgi:hypothetical protein
VETTIVITEVGDPAEVFATGMAEDLAVVVRIITVVVVVTDNGINLQIGNNTLLLGLYLHALILLIGPDPIIIPKLSKLAFLDQSHNLLPLLQLGPAQQILKLLSTPFILLSLIHPGIWTPEQHLI